MPSLENLPNEFMTQRLIVRAYRAGDGLMYYAVGQRNRAHLQRYEAMNSVLKPANAAEAEALIGEYMADWLAGRYFMWGAFEREGAAEAAAEAAADAAVEAAALEGAFVGQIYTGVVSRETPEFEVGYFADCEHAGRGYISEALQAVLAFLFEHLNAHRVRLECSDTNLRSVRVAERNGFTREAHLRENQREPDGSYTGAYIYAMWRGWSCCWTRIRPVPAYPARLAAGSQRTP